MDLVNHRIETQKFMTEQKGCRKEIMVSKEQLAQKKDRKWACCYIDYQKDHHSVSHS